MKATAVAPANIAFIKYWGRKDASLRLPYNASISMNLSACLTTTTVEFSKDFTSDHIELLEPGGFSENEVKRIVHQIDVLRAKSGISDRARVATQNTFPKSTGAASSASGFAALTVAAAEALRMRLSEKELTILARLGSGSACRSIPDGFVKWEAGDTSETSYAYSLYPHGYWDIRDILVIVGVTGKDVSSSAGHDTVGTSPHFADRLKALPDRIARLERAMAAKDFVAFGTVTEEDSLDMHHVMQTQVPPLMYWHDTTRKIMDAVRKWRTQGLPAYVTIDAGPNVHILCEGKDEKAVLSALKKTQGIQQIIVNKPSIGARLIDDHLL